MATKKQAEKNLSDTQSIKIALRDSEEKFRVLFIDAQVGLFRSRLADGKILECNDLFAKILGYRSIKECIKRLKPSNHIIDPTIRKKMFMGLQKNGTFKHFEVNINKKNGSNIWLSCSAKLFPKRKCIEGAILDITDLKLMKNNLKKNEIKLNNQKARLKEANTALNILLKKSDEDKQELEEKIVSNVTELLIPYVEKLKKCRLNHQAQSLVEIIDYNINELIGRFAGDTHPALMGLTHAEKQIANLVKHGKTSKEIAILLNLSKRTIDTHRYNIRKKMNVKNTGMNLYSYLKSLQ